MKTIRISFKSKGKNVKVTAILKDGLAELSTSAKNECFDMQSETWANGYWSLFFEGGSGVQYEVEFEFDIDNRQKTLKPIKAITWVYDVIDDVQKAEVKVR